MKSTLLVLRYVLLNLLPHRFRIHLILRKHWIDDMQALLPPLRAFILPAGSETVARCHICRTITRRLERLMVAIDHPHPDERRFVNRLSDYFFVLARNMGKKEHIEMAIWQK